MPIEIEAVRTIREQIVDRLRTDILCGALLEDQPLRESALAERFGVSRGPIRDALLQLSQEGVLVYQPNCGMRVSKQPRSGMRSLLVKLRSDIETHALASVFDRVTAADLERWERQLDDLERCCLAGDLASVVESDVKFHRDLVRMHCEDDLEAIWLPITVRMRLRYSQHVSLIDIHAEHRRIVEHIRDRDQAAAIAALRDHIR